MADSVSNVQLKDRLCNLTKRIYCEVLWTTSHEGKTFIGSSDHDQFSASSWTSRYRIVLSWDLLSWMSVEDRILCSFTNFITTRELSGPLYISPDIYHTQITEYSLDKIYQWALFLSASNISLLIVLLDPPSIITVIFSIRGGALGNTFPELIQLKWFIIYSDQFPQNTFFKMTWKRGLIWWG